ncbi:MAG: phage major capsid protein [Actinobacteria bacterium]|nr:phage major capsid protein [Actinomycetota bacterium]
MPGNANFDALLSTTLANYRSQLTDNVFTARPLTYMLMEKGRIRMLNGGTKIVEPLIYGQNSTVASYSGYDTISLTAQDGISAAEYDWKQYAASIAISGIEEAKNNGEQEIINLLEAKIMQAEESMREGFNQMFFGDGTGNSGKNWNGLGNIVESGNTVGGINSAAGQGNDWWRSYEENTAGALTLAQMATAYNSTSVGNDHIDTILTTQTLFEKYEALLQPQLRYTDTKTADAGFQNLLFKSAPVMYDVHCTAGVVYFLNTKYLTLVGHSGKWFTQTEFVRPENLDARYALIMCYGNLTCRNRAKQGKLTAKTA